MIQHKLIIPFRRHTLKECDQIICQAAKVKRTGKAKDGLVRIAECTVDIHETWRLRNLDEITDTDVVIYCGNCMLDHIFDDSDSGLVYCSMCKHKLVWRQKPYESRPR